MDIYNSTLATHQVTYVHTCACVCACTHAHFYAVVSTSHPESFHHAQYHNRDCALICVSHLFSSACCISVDPTTHTCSCTHGTDMMVRRTRLTTSVSKQGQCSLGPRCASSQACLTFGTTIVICLRYAYLPIAMFRTAVAICEAFPWRVYATTGLDDARSRGLGMVLRRGGGVE
jgi:hypothetical protein